MENIKDFNLNLAMLRKHLSGYKLIEIGEDFCIMDILPSKPIIGPEYTCKLDGVLVIYCIKGGLNLSVNLKELKLRENDLTILVPGTHLKFSGYAEGPLENNHAITISMSQIYTSNLRIDFKRILSDGMGLSETPIIHLNQDGQSLLKDYQTLLSKVLDFSATFQEETAQSLVSSMMNFLSGLWLDRMQDIKKEQQHDTNRSRMTFDNFIRLVSENYMKHRNVGFYADQLCLTPKYLSKVVKNFSGSSAPDWIDAYVILEAKNLLKYSDLAIKEIVYRLNFPNQSVFYKFFKTRTGITPSQYRNE